MLFIISSKREENEAAVPGRAKGGAGHPSSTSRGGFRDGVGAHPRGFRGALWEGRSRDRTTPAGTDGPGPQGWAEPGFIPRSPAGKRLHQLRHRLCILSGAGRGGRGGGSAQQPCPEPRALPGAPQPLPEPRALPGAPQPLPEPRSPCPAASSSLPHHAGHFHPDVFRHHRPGGPVLHHLHALRSRRRPRCGSAAASPAERRPASARCASLGAFWNSVNLCEPGAEHGAVTEPAGPGPGMGGHGRGSEGLSRCRDPAHPPARTRVLHPVRTCVLPAAGPWDAPGDARGVPRGMRRVLSPPCVLSPRSEAARLGLILGSGSHF
ncbi:collagen alpha-2(I) chain-like [Serinus canaria]|uniref:collagen alpha-2(I) chain-like n=1 Tax=Serinus canaria TaxID=9135 RepID=UPI0021CCF0F5|nr:collagen alpha-2(I) chain-like [Serinus canaria]